MSVGILILAAGASRRFGSDKRQALLPCGTTLLQQSVNNALASGLPVAVCLREGEEQLLDGDVTVLTCPDAHRGMGHSLAQGIAQVRSWDGALIALGDMPEVEPATFCIVAREVGNGEICQPVYRGKPGHPVGFPAAFYDALEGLSGDVGARGVLQENRQAVKRLPVHDAGILRDVDTPADL